jgi:hypothetical protein
MSKLVFLKYAFLFDAAESYSHLYQFERDLADFFKTKGFVAELPKMIEGYQGEKIILLKRVDSMIAPTLKQQPGRPQSIQGKFNQMRGHKLNAKERDFRKGKLLTRKGYLKK